MTDEERDEAVRLLTDWATDIATSARIAYLRYLSAIDQIEAEKERWERAKEKLLKKWEKEDGRDT